MGEPESHKKEVFNETEIERLMALEGTHGVLYDQATWRVTVTKLTPELFAFILTPVDFMHANRHPIAFCYYKDTGDLRFTSGDQWDISFVLAFLNGYIPFDLARYR